MPSYREYNQKRPISGCYNTITFYHPSFGYVRLVDKQFFPKTLGGQTYTPARFEIEEQPAERNSGNRRNGEAWATVFRYQNADEEVEWCFRAVAYHGNSSGFR